MDNYLQQGIMAAKAGDRSRAFELLMRASEGSTGCDQAWLWLSSVVHDDSERLYCLDRVLKLNSAHAVAQRGAAMLRQKGIIPAMPVHPEPQKQTSTSAFVPTPDSAPKPPVVNFTAPTPIKPAFVPIVESAPAQKSNIEMSLKKQELSGLFQYAALEISNGKPNKVVEKSLVGRGASLEVAEMIVKDAQIVVKKARSEKYKKRMTRGLLWTVAGIVITCGTMAFADNLGGKFVLFYGAIIYGFIDFIIGLIGWLVNG